MAGIKLIAILSFSVLLAVGCGGAAGNLSTNANTNSNVSANTEVTLDPANMPPGLSGSPMVPSANTPGIPMNPGPLPKGTTPTPGIPSEAELKKGMKPGVTPTPGIPDAATIRKQLGLPPVNVNATPPKGSKAPMMKSNRRPAGKPQ